MHARSPAPARPASLLLHDAPAHVPPALTITHQRSGERRAAPEDVSVQTGAIMNASVVRVSR